MVLEQLVVVGGTAQCEDLVMVVGAEGLREAVVALVEVGLMTGVLCSRCLLTA